MDELQAAQAMLTSLGVGLLMGLERERRAGAVAGLRTFALVALAGSICALLTLQAQLGWLIPAGALGIVGMMVAADRAGAAPDTTSTVALLLCFLFGAMLGFGHTHLTVAMTLATTALLYFKAELHDVTQRLTRQDIVSFLQFALITFVVLPVLPDEGFGPYGQLNPYRIWLMVVLTAGISLAGYAALRLAKDGHAIPLLGALGGLVSSTVTTLVFSRAARDDARQAPAAIAVILIANLVLLARIGVLAAVVAPAALGTLAPVLAAGLVAGIAWPLRGWIVLARGSARALAPGIGNPASLPQALAFGAAYAVVLVLSAAVNARAGYVGVYAISALSGMADMDAAAISDLQLFSVDQLSASQAVRAIVIALGVNMGIKALIVLLRAGWRTALEVAAHYLAVLAALALATLALA